MVSQGSVESHAEIAFQSFPERSGITSEKEAAGLIGQAAQLNLLLFGNAKADEVRGKIDAAHGQLGRQSAGIGMAGFQPVAHQNNRGLLLGIGALGPPASQPRSKGCFPLGQGQNSGFHRRAISNMECGCHVPYPREIGKRDAKTRVSAMVCAAETGEIPHFRL
jgi:hypothetical protein